MIGFKNISYGIFRRAVHGPSSISPIVPSKLIQFRQLAPTQLRFYSNKRIDKTQQAPKLRYLFYVFLLSSGMLYFVGQNVDKRQPPKKKFTEREFKEYEQASGLKRRSKLIGPELQNKYKFYVIPYVHDESFVDRVAAKLNKKEVKIIDPQELIKREMEDEGRKYCYLLQDLTAQNKTFPKGLITAIIKEEIKFFLNTTKGQYDTNFIIKNYPQSTDEAIKFENDVSNIEKCVALHYDILNELPKEKSDREVRLINNVIGYFETVEKVRTIADKHDRMDDILEEIILEDF